MFGKQPEKIDIYKLKRDIVEELKEELKKKPKAVEKLLQEMPVEIKIIWKDKKKGMILCNACQGTGRRANSYSESWNCTFCDGLGFIKLREV